MPARIQQEQHAARAERALQGVLAGALYLELFKSSSEGCRARAGARSLPVCGASPHNRSAHPIRSIKKLIDDKWALRLAGPAGLGHCLHLCSAASQQAPLAAVTAR